MKKTQTYSQNSFICVLYCNTYFYYYMLVLFAYLLYLFLNTHINLPFQIMADCTSPSKIPKIHHPEADVIHDRLQLLAVRL